MKNLKISLWILPFALCVLHCAYPSASAQPTRPTPGQPSAATDIILVKRVISARREYQHSLEQLHAYYESIGDAERQRWAEAELIQFHRVPKAAYIIDLDVAGPGLHPDQNVPAANELYRKAMSKKGKGFGSDYQDNLIRSELLFQQLLSQYPTSNKCSDAAYQLADIYEIRKPPQYRRAAAYFERCVQWNPSTQYDARSRAARLYDRQLNERGKAVELYRAVLNYETDERRRQEAQRRLGELSGATP
jgi:tetratricopeptide (TPR) repeat protein